MRHIFTGVPGRAHDRNAIEWDIELLQWLNTLPPNYVLLSDSAYEGFHTNVMHLFRNPQTDRQRNVNRLGRKLRVKIENVIGANECIWRALMRKENRLPALKGVRFPNNCAISAAVLHNRFTNYCL